MKQKPSYLPKKYKYSARSGNLKAEAVGVVTVSYTHLTLPTNSLV